MALREAAGGPGKPLRLYCWRRHALQQHGLVSELERSPGHSAGGGYKRYRRWVLAQLRLPAIACARGRTGTGKTDLLLQLERDGVGVVDLEGLAHHRSSFGNLGLPAQPSSEHYENKLAERLDALNISQAPEIWLEAESIQVGRCRIPKGLFSQMQTVPVLEIQRSEQERVERLVQATAATNSRTYGRRRNALVND